jgi:hypothetical protein
MVSVMEGMVRMAGAGGVGGQGIEKLKDQVSPPLFSPPSRPIT